MRFVEREGGGGGASGSVRGRGRRREGREGRVWERMVWKW